MSDSLARLLSLCPLLSLRHLCARNTFFPLTPHTAAGFDVNDDSAMQRCWWCARRVLRKLGPVLEDLFHSSRATRRDEILNALANQNDSTLKTRLCSLRFTATWPLPRAALVSPSLPLLTLDPLLSPSSSFGWALLSVCDVPLGGSRLSYCEHNGSDEASDSSPSSSSLLRSPFASSLAMVHLAAAPPCCCCSSAALASRTPRPERCRVRDARSHRSFFLLGKQSGALTPDASAISSTALVGTA